MSARKKTTIKKQIFKLDADEQNLEYALKEEHFTSIDGIALEKELAVKAATRYLKKEARINIRLSKIDLERIKEKAAYEGLPYQTFISSILHKYVSGPNRDV